MSVALGVEVGMSVEFPGFGGASGSTSVTETYETSRTVEQSFERSRTVSKHVTKSG